MPSAAKAICEDAYASTQAMYTRWEPSLRSKHNLSGDAQTPGHGVSSGDEGTLQSAAGGTEGTPRPYEATTDTDCNATASVKGM